MRGCRRHIWDAVIRRIGRFECWKQQVRLYPAMRFKWPSQNLRGVCGEKDIGKTSNNLFYTPVKLHSPNAHPQASIERGCSSDQRNTFIGPWRSQMTSNQHVSYITWTVVQLCTKRTFQFIGMTSAAVPKATWSQLLRTHLRQQS